MCPVRLRFWLLQAGKKVDFWMAGGGGHYIECEKKDNKGERDTRARIAAQTRSRKVEGRRRRGKV